MAAKTDVVCVEVSASHGCGDTALQLVLSGLGIRNGETCVCFENDDDLFGMLMVCASVDDG